MSSIRALLTMSSAVLVLAGAGAAQAQSPAEFFKGKTISVVISGGAGGSYALYGQLLVDHYPRFLPGAPKMVAQFMPGGGGTKAANYLYNVAPKDGTSVGILYDTTGIAQVLRPAGIKYDVRKFNWIGQFVPLNTVIAVTAESGARTIADAQKRELIMGSTGRSAPSFINMSVANALIGTKFKIITGYKDTASTELAMERGETHGGSAAWMNWRARHSAWIESGRLVPLVQVALKRMKDLPNVPTLLELAKNDSDRQLIEFIAAGGATGRTVAAPPDVPPERVEAMRRAFDAMVADARFVSEAKQRKLDVDPDTGEETQKLLARTVSIPEEVVKRANAIFGSEGG